MESSGGPAREGGGGGGSALHRKIELQASEDLSYLLANVRRAAAARIDEAFPPVDGAHDEDELRIRIEELVDEYITKTFTLASPNLSINGFPVSPEAMLSPNSTVTDPSQPNEVYAPFDARLRSRVEELTREEEDLFRDIAALKKSVPATAAATWGDAFKKSVKDDEDSLAARIETVTTNKEGGSGSGSGGGGGDGGLEMTELERQAEVEQRYGNAVQGLARMKREMPAVVARMERARGAGSYVITER